MEVEKLRRSAILKLIGESELDRQSENVYRWTGLDFILELIPVDREGLQIISDLVVGSSPDKRDPEIKRVVLIGSDDISAYTGSALYGSEVCKYLENSGLGWKETKTGKYTRGGFGKAITELRLDREIAVSEETFEQDLKKCAVDIVEAQYKLKNIYHEPVSSVSQYLASPFSA